MVRSKGLKRLAFFIIFLIPVTWYLILQLFGDNKFALELQGPIPEACRQFEEITIIHRSDSLSISQTNYFDRISYKTTQKKITLIADTIGFFSCVKRENDLALVSDEGIWGSYTLDREGTDQLLTELDILLLQKSYGRGVNR